ncbi:helix-hairpin-helix domain-containing protein [Aquibacillus koreensis]|uniref:Helix-hairpin-helix domain-containing protein n=1 Tax=Aquibacillus koreensis TaxID=279446 RepID=A0A9X3WFZ2_9BACI|nr:helix-hairpin-helix domain-containing protein [Aquibacillus koreensis]MCT2537626.1 helix-hairpin-helix domain-containing protein [Aquibacillus koreensis]MDC3419072.1 helix-hairpin-helix domain-containing protein [Aquibacillus koreensis]
MNWIKNNWIIILIIGIMLVYVFIDQIKSPKAEEVYVDNGYELAATIQDDNVPEEIANQSSAKQEVKYVDVKGEVNNPGVFRIEDGDRVVDIIERAGGFTKDANQETVNLAQKVIDEMVIHVSAIGEENAPIAVVNEGNNKIRINIASKEDLLSLTGIGEVKANAIIEYRESNGPFKTIEDLKNVNGIGAKTIEQIVEQIVIP